MAPSCIHVINETKDAINNDPNNNVYLSSIEGMKKAFQPKKPVHTVPVLGKAIRLFEAVARGSSEPTAKQLAVSLRIAPSTCYRILQSFVAAGWLRSGAGGAFEISFGLVPLLQPLLRHELLMETMRGPLAELTRRTGLTAKVTVRQGDDAVTLMNAPSPQTHAIASRAGAVISLAIGSSGAAFLGALPDSEVARILNAASPEVWKFQRREDVLRRVREVRRVGCCYDGGSYQPNIHTLSAPLYTRENEVICAITLLGFPQDFAGTAKAALVRELEFTAGGCNQIIQSSGSSPTT